MRAAELQAALDAILAVMGRPMRSLREQALHILAGMQLQASGWDKHYLDDMSGIGACALCSRVAPLRTPSVALPWSVWNRNLALITAAHRSAVSNRHFSGMDTHCLMRTLSRGNDVCR